MTLPPPTCMAGAAVPAAGLAGVCAAIAIVGLADAARARARARPRRGHHARVRRAIGMLAAPLGRRAPTPPDLQRRLDAAGAPATLAAADVMAVKAALALAGALVAAAAQGLAPGRLGLLVLAGLPAAGFLAPDAAVHRRARRRAERIGLELPDVAELLRVAIDAGLPPTRALAEVGRRHPGVLAGELRAVAARLELGVSQREALAVLRRRAPVQAVGALTAALERSARHGAPLGPTLAAIAEDARTERARRLRDRAARAAPQIQLVVALLLVPAVLLLVAAGLAGSLL